MDAAGETKVTLSGHLEGGRQYSLKTFTIIGHGKMLFMLATDVARLTGYRDSHLFFLRNRQLRKVVTTQAERNDLLQREVIPFSYRYRRISAVTARSVFIRFGHRVIINGQRIRDDYYENLPVLQEKFVPPIPKRQSKATNLIVNHQHQNHDVSPFCLSIVPQQKTILPCSTVSKRYIETSRLCDKAVEPTDKAALQNVVASVPESRMLPSIRDHFGELLGKPLSCITCSDQPLSIPLSSSPRSWV